MKSILFTLAALAFLTGEAVAQTATTPAAPATGHNVHKERDHRFKACKAAAKEAGVANDQLQAYMAECLKKAQ